MDVTTITDVDRETAGELYRAYLKDRHYDTPIDREVRRTYKALAQGKTVIKALESIVNAGVDEHGLPKLGIVRADQTRCICHRDETGRFELAPPSHSRRTNAAADMRFAFAAGSLPRMPNPRRKDGAWFYRDYEAVVPMVPKHLRPRRALASYHILWEVEEWSPVRVPRDPYLLRRLGKGDLWLVVAAWDLTEVERAALQSRVSVN